jgi:cobalt-zinc-cadmium efflux system membrane fusion protein
MPWPAGLAFAAVAAMGCGSKSSGQTQEAAQAVEPEQKPGIVRLTPEQMTTAKIGLGKVERRAEAGRIAATAQIEPPADGVARVGPRLAGRVTTLKAGVGDKVQKGQILAVVDSPELARAKADYLSALAGAKVTRESSAREKALFDQHISSERDWRQAEADATRARAEKDATENRLHTLGLSEEDLRRLNSEGHYTSTMPAAAPLDGLVVERQVTLGQMVEPKDTMFVIMDLRTVWVLLDVYEKDLAQVKPGQPARARVTAFPDRMFTGKVDSIGAIVEARTRAVKVRVVLPNPSGELRPGMFATVEVEGTVGEKKEGLYAPAAAFQRDGEQAIVFVTRGEREFERRAVKLGPAAGDWALVEEGLSDGETVVTTGSFVLKSELKKSQLGGEE